MSDIKHKFKNVGEPVIRIKCSKNLDSIKLKENEVVEVKATHKRGPVIVYLPKKGAKCKLSVVGPGFVGGKFNLRVIRKGRKKLHCRSKSTGDESKIVAKPKAFKNDPASPAKKGRRIQFEEDREKIVCKFHHRLEIWFVAGRG